MNKWQTQDKLIKKIQSYLTFFWIKSINFLLKKGYLELSKILDLYLYTVESRFKKARFKKESWFKKDCWYNQFFSIYVVWFKKDFLRSHVRFKKDFFPKSGKNRDFLTILEQFLGFFQFFFQLLASYSTIQFIFLKKELFSLKPVRIMNRLPK